MGKIRQAHAPRRPRTMEAAIEKSIEDLDDGSRSPVAKAHFIGQDVQGSNARMAEERQRDDRLFEQSGAIGTPYSPDTMVRLFEHSNSLRQNVDSYGVNIDGNGHRFEPVIDLDADMAHEAVRDAMFVEALIAAETGEANAKDGTTPQIPTDEEVDRRIEVMRTEMRLEKSKLMAFFDFCVADESFISLRRKTRQDKEIMGNGFWEILRNSAGEPAQFVYVPGFTVRLLPIDRNPIEVAMKVKRAPLTYETQSVKRRFRRFVQVFEGCRVYFKEYGDPRVVSSKTGKVYKTDAELQSNENVSGEPDSAVAQATEILHFSIHSPRSPYGIPRWIGNLLAVLGSRQSEEVNFLYFENKSVPPMAVLVSGGRLTSESVKKIESFIETRIKGRANFHKVLVIEAEPAMAGTLDQNNGRMKIEIVPLTSAQQSDALFQKYDERNIDKVGMAFRLPRLLRGDIRDFNRATAEAAIEFAETQVFAPERQDFDWAMNRKILSDLGIKYWTFASNAPTTRNPIDLADIVTMLVNASVLTPEEGRELAKGIFNRDFKKIDDLWTKIPPNLLMKGILPDGAEPPPGMGTSADGAPAPTDGAPNQDPNAPNPPTPPGFPGPKRGEKDGRLSIPKRYAGASRAAGLRKLARDLVDLREVLDEQAREEGRESFEKAHDESVETETITMPAEDMDRILGVKPLVA